MLPSILLKNLLPQQLLLLNELNWNQKLLNCNAPPPSLVGHDVDDGGGGVTMVQSSKPPLDLIFRQWFVGRAGFQAHLFCPAAAPVVWLCSDCVAVTIF